MALKDLAADLKNFRYGISSPDKVDNQIKNGVDFFDDNEGGATGFTPKTDLESLYHKVQNGTVAAPNAGVVENNKTRSAYGSDGEYGLSSFVTENSQYLANPRFIVSSDRIAGVRNQPQFLSPFLDLPIADYVSQYPKEPSLTWGLGVDEDGLPIDGTMLGPVGPKVQPFHISDFMTVPLEDRLTRFPNSDGNMPGISLTFKNDVLEFTGPVGKKDTIVKLINDKRRGFYDHIITPTKDHQPFPVNVNSSLDLYNPNYERYFNEMNGNSIHISPNGELKAGRGYNGLFGGVNNGIAITDNFSSPGSENYSGVANLYPGFLANIDNINITSQKRIVPISARIGLASQLSPLEQIELSDLYQQLDVAQNNLGNAQANQDDFSGATADFNASSQYAQEVSAIENQISQLEGLESFAGTSFIGSLAFKIKPIKSSAKQKSFKNEGYGIADYLSENNLGEFNWGTGDLITLANVAGAEEGKVLVKKRRSLFDSTAVPFIVKAGKIDNDKKRYGGKDYTEVPSGLNEYNQFGTLTFREVADPGKFNHPLILREMGNNWGMDSLGDNPISEAIGGLVRGAPGITGLMSRSLNDKFRIGKFMFNTSDGIAFVLKQTALQALNPTLESKIYNPLSTLGLVGAGDAFDAVKGLFGGGINGLFKLDTYKTAIKGLAKFAASALLDIGQPERHLGGGRYESVINGPLGSRLQYQSKAFSIEVRDINLPQSNTGFGLLDNYLNKKIEQVEGGIQAAQYSAFFTQVNPNKYTFPISSAPKSLVDGVPSFLGSADLVLSDVNKAISKPGGTFNTESANVKDPFSNSVVEILKSYSQLNKSNSYEIKSKEEVERPDFFGRKFNAFTELIDLIPQVSNLSFDRTVDSTFPGLGDLLGGGVRSFERQEVTQRGDSALAEKIGGNFNPQTAVNETTPGHLEGRDILTRHNTFPYDEIKYENRYEQSLESPSDKATISKDDIDAVIAQREDDKEISRNIGVLNNFVTKQKVNHLGLIKKGTDVNLKTDNTDKVNMTPITSNKNVATQHPDFIKFMFRDVINNKYLVFRAIVDGITDTITPEYGEVKYIGRPDKLYNYQGTERSVSFNFKIYPKTKQELPVLMEKVNYLVGLCYPSYTSKERMVTPFVELTLGDMFNDTPGLLESVTVTVEDATTWEIDEGLQFPHFISCQCTFKYVGKAENTPVALGKFYDISWLKGDNRVGEVGAPIGTFANREDDNPLRINSEGNGSFEYINSLNAEQ